MLRPQDNAIPGAEEPRRTLGFHPGSGWRGSRRRLVPWTTPRRPGHGGPGHLQRARRRCGGAQLFGDIWYQTVVRVPRGWQDRRVALYFESATHRATVWVDDTEVGSHEGGYTPFEFDITDQAAAVDSVRITVAVN